MGFFSNLFSKKKCELCEKEVGALNRFKIKGDVYICKECRKNTSAFLKIENYTLDEIKSHIEYMKKQNKFYESVFAKLPKDKIQRCVYQGFYGIVFADELGMFEIIMPEANKRNYKELFRYDQIKDYMVYGKENVSTSNGEKRYSETGLRILMNCERDINNVGSGKEAKKFMHPYAMEFILPVDKNTDNKNGGQGKNHLNKIFGRPDETLVGSIKEAFTGTQHERTGMKAAGEALGALGSFVKGDKEAANEKMNKALESGIDYLSENRSKYNKIADEAEKNYMGNTFKELFK